jgi:hypothetical protein
MMYVESRYLTKMSTMFVIYYNECMSSLEDVFP